jgi:hypothetical protein
MQMQMRNSQYNGPSMKMPTVDVSRWWVCIDNSHGYGMAVAFEWYWAFATWISGIVKFPLLVSAKLTKATLALLHNC